MKLKLFFLLAASLLTIANVHTARADVYAYNVVATFYEPETQPFNTVFTGSFTYDSTTNTVSNLTGTLNEAMIGPTLINLTYVVSGGTGINTSDGQGGQLVAVFFQNSPNTFNGGGSAPGTGNAIYYGWPSAPNPDTGPTAQQPGALGNAYALIDVPANPLAPLATAQLNQLAYADCTNLGMMGSTCMTGTDKSVYGMAGTMGAYPIAEVITLGSLSPTAYDACLFNWAESNYPALFAPAGATTETSGVYLYRYYSATKGYLGVSSANGLVYYQGPEGGAPQKEGTLYDWLPKASCPVPTPTDCLFNWAEANYPALFAPAGAATETSGIYTYRYYSATKYYLGVSSADNDVYYMGSNGVQQKAGPASSLLPLAGCQ